jgi:hypothetical protein
LDVIEASQVNVLEIQDGFAARYERADVESVVMQRFFTFDEVRDLSWGDLKLRRRFRRRGFAEPGGYQDLFRALGYELDATSAFQARIDESGDVLTLDYCTPPPAGESVPLQHRDVLGPDERSRVRQAAKARRRQQGRWRLIFT